VIHTAQDFDELDLDAILSHPGPTLLDVRVDKEEGPPMELRLRIMNR
jgi:acetolactate synthase I/II/III large subunit